MSSYTFWSNFAKLPSKDGTDVSSRWLCVRGLVSPHAQAQCHQDASSSIIWCASDTFHCCVKWHDFLGKMGIFSQGYLSFVLLWIAGSYPLSILNSETCVFLLISKCSLRIKDSKSLCLKYIMQFIFSIQNFWGSLFMTSFAIWKFKCFLFFLYLWLCGHS